MAIIEDYVGFETAKLLKEKGFPQEYDIYNAMVYNEDDYEDEYEIQRMVTETKLVKAGTLSSYPASVPEPKCYCPTLQMAMKWLREEYNIHISIYIFNRELPVNSVPIYTCDIATEKLSSQEGHLRGIWKTYEEACEAAIKHCLTNML